MAKTKTNDIIVGLDIGTNKVACIVGEVTDDGVDIIGIGSAKSNGLRRGYVVNIDSTVTAIQQAVDEAENMAGCEITTVYAAISGAHVRGVNSNGIVAVKDGEVRAADIARVIDQAKAVPIPMDREVLHVLPQQYVVDDQDGIRDPLGMAGVRLEAKVHIITTAVASAQNVIKCANRCNLQVADIVLESLASASAVLEDDEKELGVAVLDIGGGTCDLMVYSDGAIVHTAVLPLGGGHVTNDIATVLRTPLDSAEKMKRKYGCAWRGLVDANDKMEVPSVGGRGPRVIPRMELVEVIEPRVEEIFEHVKKELLRSGLLRRPGGRRGAHRWCHRDGGCHRGRRARAPPAGAPRRSDQGRWSRRRGALARVLDGRRARDVRRRAGPHRPAPHARRRSPGHVQARVVSARRDVLSVSALEKPAHLIERRKKLSVRSR
jgi:cell division protein FtsA